MKAALSAIPSRPVPHAARRDPRPRAAPAKMRCPRATEISRRYNVTNMVRIVNRNLKNVWAEVNKSHSVAIPESYTFYSMRSSAASAKMLLSM